MTDSVRVTVGIDPNFYVLRCNGCGHTRLMRATVDNVNTHDWWRHCHEVTCKQVCMDRQQFLFHLSCFGQMPIITDPVP